MKNQLKTFLSSARGGPNSMAKILGASGGPWPDIPLYPPLLGSGHYVRKSQRICLINPELIGFCICMLVFLDFVDSYFAFVTLP